VERPASSSTEFLPSEGEVCPSGEILSRLLSSVWLPSPDERERKDLRKNQERSRVQFPLYTNSAKGGAGGMRVGRDCNGRV